MTEHCHIGAVIFPRLDQLDFTGPFEVLSRLPETTFHVIGQERGPVRDMQGLLLTAELSFAEAPPLDVLVVPGGYGQEERMEDEVFLTFLREKAATASYLLSVCTGALLCGAAGLLRGVRATTHWSAFHLLGHFGAIPVDERVVVDGKVVSAAGVTAGIDAALRLAALLRGEQAAQEVQLVMQYAPKPPFGAGSPSHAPVSVRNVVQDSYRQITAAREQTARRVAARLGLPFSP